MEYITKLHLIFFPSINKAVGKFNMIYVAYLKSSWDIVGRVFLEIGFLMES